MYLPCYTCFDVDYRNLEYVNTEEDEIRTENIIIYRRNFDFTKLLNIKNLKKVIIHMRVKINSCLDCLPIGLTHLILPNIYNFSLNNLPHTLTHLVVCNGNFDFRMLPSGLKFLKIIKHGNYSLDELPNSIETLILPNYNGVINFLPSSLLRLILGNYKVRVNSYPTGLKYLRFYKSSNQILNNLPDSIEKIILQDCNQETSITKFPANLKHFQADITCNTNIIKNLPKLVQLKIIDKELSLEYLNTISSCNYEEFESTITNEERIALSKKIFKDKKDFLFQNINHIILNKFNNQLFTFNFKNITVLTINCKNISSIITLPDYIKVFEISKTYTYIREILEKYSEFVHIYILN